MQGVADEVYTVNITRESLAPHLAEIRLGDPGNPNRATFSDLSSQLRYTYPIDSNSSNPRSVFVYGTPTDSTGDQTLTIVDVTSLPPITGTTASVAGTMNSMQVLVNSTPPDTARTVAVQVAYDAAPDDKRSYILTIATPYLWQLYDIKVEAAPSVQASFEWNTEFSPGVFAYEITITGSDASAPGELQWTVQSSTNNEVGRAVHVITKDLWNDRVSFNEDLTGGNAAARTAAWDKLRTDRTRFESIGNDAATGWTQLFGAGTSQTWYEDKYAYMMFATRYAINTGRGPYYDYLPVGAAYFLKVTKPS